MISSKNYTNTNASSLRMKLDELLRQSINQLSSASVPTPRLDCLVLLEDLTEKSRGWLLAHPEFEVSQDNIKTLTKQLERRVKHEPLAYIRGKSEFYGREFIVNEHTLQPRPESETMIELLEKFISNHRSPISINGKPAANERPQNSISGSAGDMAKGTITIVDVGTGSGCLAITAKLLHPSSIVHATDIDAECIQTTRLNAAKHQVEVSLHQGNLIEPLLPIISRQSDVIILANLPYVPDSHTINAAAMHEPKHAIFGGADGLDYYRELFEQLSTSKHKPVAIFTESLPNQHRELQLIAENHDYRATLTNDFIVRFTLESKNV